MTIPDAEASLDLQGQRLQRGIDRLDQRMQRLDSLADPYKLQLARDRQREEQSPPEAAASCAGSGACTAAPLMKDHAGPKRRR
ncbi:MAG: hypothetical protein ACT6VO_26145 [Hydrogenophaga sp.]